VIVPPEDLPPLRVYNPDAEPYVNWSVKMELLRHQLRELWNRNRSQSFQPWTGIERRKQAR
jgi:hypothetical protein